MIIRCLLFLALATSVALGDLQATVRDLVAVADLGGGSAAVCIVDVASGRTLAAVDSERGLIPASNAKLLTSGAAIHVLGPDFAFSTRLLRDGDRLVVVGDGDPSLGDPFALGVDDWTRENEALDALLDAWVLAVASARFDDVAELIVDDRIFDRNFIHPSWPADQVTNWYCAQVAGLNFHCNVLHFLPSPGRAGRADLGPVAPHMPFLDIANRTTTRRGKGDRSTFWVARPPGTNDLTARGNVRGIHREPVKVALHDPPLLFGALLAHRLAAAGISVGEVRVAAASDPAFTGTLLHEHRTPLAAVLRRCNRDSYNLHAEALLKRIAAALHGGNGSFEEGGAIVERVVAQRTGASHSSLRAADGSGMSRRNRVSPRTLVTWLATFRLDERAGAALWDSLAQAGESGTLASRFASVDLGDAQVRAKSGYLRGTSALSGYIRSGEQLLAFSVIVNDVTGTVRGAKRLQERIVAAAASAAAPQSTLAHSLAH